MEEERQERQGLLVKYSKENKDNEGRTIFNHIQKILAHIAFNDPTVGLDKFEEISYELRTKGSVEIAERFLNYKSLSESAKSWFQPLYEKYYEVFLFS